MTEANQSLPTTKKIDQPPPSRQPLVFSPCKHQMSLFHDGRVPSPIGAPPLRKEDWRRPSVYSALLPK